MRGRALNNLVTLSWASASGKSWESFARGIVWTALGVVIGCAVLNLGVAIDSYSMVSAFDMDEGLSGAFLDRALSSRSLDPDGFFNYGFSYIAAPYYVIRALELLGYRVSDHLIFYVGRAISLASYVVALAATYCAARRSGVGKTLATLSVGVLGAVSSLSAYAQIFRPDLPQVAAVAVALACLSKPTAASMLAATAFASLGFGLKYSGAFVLVPIAVSGVLSELSGRAPWRGSVLRRIALVTAIPAIFVGVWLATNPYVIPQWSEFLTDLEYEQAHVQRGHQRVESADSAVWIGVLREDLPAPGLLALSVGVVGLLAVAAGEVVTRPRRPGLRRLRRALRSPRRRFLIATAAYVAVTSEFLLVEVRMRRARYWMYIVPGVVILAAAGWARLFRFLRDRAKRPVLLLAATGVATLLGATASARSEIGNRLTEERVRLGDWIAERYSPLTRIVADAYTYLPPYFHYVRTGASPSHRVILHDRPDLVILSRYSTGASCWMRPGTLFAQAQFDCSSRDGHEQVRETLGWLVSESGFQVKRESPSFVVLWKKQEREAAAKK